MKADTMSTSTPRGRTGQTKEPLNGELNIDREIIICKVDFT